MIAPAGRARKGAHPGEILPIGAIIDAIRARKPKLSGAPFRRILKMQGESENA